MSHQNRILSKVQKLWKHLFDSLGIHYHGIIYRGQLGNSKGNRHSRIYKNIHPVNNFSVFNLHRTDFNNMIDSRIKTGGLQIKDHGGTA